MGNDDDDEMMAMVMTMRMAYAKEFEILFVNIFRILP